jgi:hypothetical protein
MTAQPLHIAPSLRERTSGGVQMLWLVAFSLFFLFMRAPQFTAQWDGEDGNGHNSAMLMGLAAPNELIYSRIDGEAHFSINFISHPSPPYLLFSLIGKIVRTVVPLDMLHGQALIFALKATASLLQLGVFIGFLFLASRFTRTKVAIVWLWVLEMAPVALYSSNEVQTDSSTGFILIALFFMGALVAQSPETGRPARLLALFVGSLAAGLGKNEWTSCLAAALLFTALAHPLIHCLLVRRLKVDLIGPAHDALPMLCIAAAGLAVGNYASYLLDPSDYIGGWQLLGRMIFRATVLSGDTGTWWTYFEKIPYILFHLIVDASILIHLLRRPQIYSATILLAFMFANALFWSYVISSWGSFPRYFAPAYIGLGATFLIILMRLPTRDGWSWTVVATIMLVALQSAYYQRTTHYWRLWRGNTDILAWITKHENNPERCVLVVDYSFVLDRPNVEFIHAPYGRDFVDQYLTEIGRSACPH